MWLLYYIVHQHLLCSGSRDNSVRLWNMPSRRCVAVMEIPRNLVCLLYLICCTTDTIWYSICVCKCVHMCVCVCVCVCVCTRLDVYLISKRCKTDTKWYSIYAYKCVHMCVCMCVYACGCVTYIYMLCNRYQYIHVSVSICVCVCVCLCMCWC